MLLSKDLKCFYLIIGLLIFPSQKDVVSGTLMKKYIDMSIMGIGTNTLGYGHDEVDSAVNGTIQKGNMSTLSCPEEVFR